MISQRDIASNVETIVSTTREREMTHLPDDLVVDRASICRKVRALNTHPNTLVEVMFKKDLLQVGVFSQRRKENAMCDWQVIGVIAVFVVLLVFLVLLMCYYAPKSECKPRERVPREKWDPLYVKLAFVTLWLIIIGVFLGIACGRLEASCGLSALFWIILIVLIFIC